MPGSDPSATKSALRAELLEVLTGDRDLATVTTEVRAMADVLYPYGRASAAETALTASGLARGELVPLLREAVSVTPGPYGWPESYIDADGEQLAWEPWWNAFDHPIHHDLGRDEGERRATAALELLRTVTARLW